ncbi:hypothetical protein SJ956_14170, partial [Enterococcus faecium]
LSQNVVHSDSDLILHNSSVLIDKEPLLFEKCSGFLFSLIIIIINNKNNIKLNHQMITIIVLI